MLKQVETKTCIQGMFEQESHGLIYYSFPFTIVNLRDISEFYIVYCESLKKNK